MDNDDFVQNVERQWHEQVERAKHQTIVQRLQAINEQISAFESRYGGTFQDLFGHLSDVEIDAMSEAVDIADWKELIEARKRLIEEYDRDDIPDGVYAVPPDPNKPRVMVRKLVDYCGARGIPLSEAHRLLPPEIMEQFLEYPNKGRAEGEKEQD